MRYKKEVIERDANFRVCPWCDRIWIAREDWLEDTTLCANEARSYGIIVDVRRHDHCGGRMYDDGFRHQPPKEEDQE